MNCQRHLIYFFGCLLCICSRSTADGQSTSKTDRPAGPKVKSTLEIVHSHEQLKINRSPIKFPARPTELYRLLGKPDAERTVDTSNPDGRIELTWHKHGISGVKNPKTGRVTSIYIYFDKTIWRLETSLPRSTYQGVLKFGKTAIDRKTTKQQLVRYGFSKNSGPYPSHLHLRKVPAACTVLQWNGNIHGVSFHDGNITK